MLEYQGVTLFSATEVLAKSKAKCSKKTFEFMRDALGFLPKPLKIAQKHGRGTIGYYPDGLIDLLKKIEKEHSAGKSYPKIAQELKAEGDAMREVMEKLRSAHEAEKDARKALSRNWTVDLQPAQGVKHADMVITLSPTEKVFVEVKKRGDSIKLYLFNWEGNQYREACIDGSDKSLEQLQDIIREAQGKINALFKGTD